MSISVPRNTRVLGFHCSCAHRLSRIAIALTLLLSLLLPGLAIARVTAQDNDSGDVPMFRGNPARTGEMPGPGPDPAEEIVARWVFQPGVDVSSSPAVVDGVVYVVTQDGNVYALDADSGTQHWTVQFGLVEANASFSPAVVDGVVFVGSNDGYNSAYHLHAIDAVSGTQRWAFRSKGHITSSAVVDDGVVYVGGRGGSWAGDYYLYAIDADSGTQRWALETSDLLRSSPAVDDGVVYVGSQDGILYAIDAASGLKRWAFATGGAVFSTPAVVEDVVYAGSGDGNVYAIDAASGTQHWAFATEGEVLSSPAVVDGVVYIGSDDGNLYAIDAATGTQRWAFQTGNWVRSSPAVVDGVVYVGGDGNLHAIDADSGEQHWSVATGGWMFSSPAVVDGVVYVGTSGGNLYAIGNLTPAAHTATAEAASTATAQANLDATATSIAGATATIEAQAMATSEAIQLSWQNYFWTNIYDAFSTAVSEFPGMSVDGTSNIRIAESYVPAGYSRIAHYPVPIEGGPASALVLLAIFPSKADADAAMENISGGLIRSGWATQDVKGLKHNHVCLTVEYSSMSEALCYMTRDDALIISYSAITLPKPEAVLLNAVDLANAMNGAYNQVDRPD